MTSVHSAPIGSTPAFGLRGQLDQRGAQRLQLGPTCAVVDGGGHTLCGTTQTEDTVRKCRELGRGQHHRVVREAGALARLSLFVPALSAGRIAVTSSPADRGVEPLATAPQAELGFIGHGCAGYGARLFARAPADLRECVRGSVYLSDRREARGNAQAPGVVEVNVR